MWYDSDDSISPSVLKKAIGKFQPMFVGYEQHDSGELISYLLDGLHEDLNRIKNKPYTESKDYDGRPDAVLAKESWELFLLRNKSVVVDLMYGQYKSRLDCPKCTKVSVTFDPFLMVPLPIPQNSTKTIELRYIPDHIKNIKIEIQYEKDNNPKMQDIVDIAAKRLGVSNKMIISGSTYYSSDFIEPDSSANERRK
jgi:ubiquitin carboxyl-terminal hydrolase 4/11/15